MQAPYRRIHLFNLINRALGFVFVYIYLHREHFLLFMSQLLLFLNLGLAGWYKIVGGSWDVTWQLETIRTWD